MTVFQFARHNAWRKPVRTLMLMFSIAVAFVIYGLTASFVSGSQGAESASTDRLIVTNAAGRSQPLPLSYLARIGADPDVAAVAYSSRIRGYAVNERNVVAVSAVDPQQMAAVSGAELGITPDLLASLDQAHDNALVGRTLAETQGWKIGQHVSITAFQTARTDGSKNWSFNIAGIFDGARADVDTYFMIARYDYVNRARARDRDTVDGFIVLPREAVPASVLAPKIDAMFANSAAPTKTQSEKQFLEDFIRQIADIGLIVNLVVGAAFVTILMIVINTMIFAIRERTFEIGVLKTLGFSRGWIMGVVIVETMFISVLGGFAGLAIARLACLFADPALGLAFTPIIFAKAAGLIVALGFFTGILPAFNAMRMSILSALKSR